jgi:hypothetical protein
LKTNGKPCKIVQRVQILLKINKMISGEQK